MDQARSNALEFLDRLYEGTYTFVLPEGRTTEHSWAWGVVFDTQEHLDTGDITKAPISRLLYVPQDGSPVGFVPTVFRSEETLVFLETGATPEHLLPKKG